MLDSIFFFQNPALLIGLSERRHPICPCQKQPFTKMTRFFRETTMSGFPGSDRTWRRYRIPICDKAFRTRISGFVLEPDTRDMIQLLFFFVNTSATRMIFYRRPTPAFTNKEYAACATPDAKSGGTAFPICLAISIFVPLNSKSSGNDCNLAASRCVMGRCIFG